VSAIVFSPQEDEHFIESVRKYPELYDISHMQYKNVLIKYAKWKEIFGFKIRNQLVSFFLGIKYENNSSFSSDSSSGTFKISLLLFKTHATHYQTCW
jgi:hypothetical protein